MAIEFAPGKRPCFIGVGYSPCHRYAPRSLGSIAYEAVTNAVADAGIELAQIDGIAVYPNPLGVNRGIVGHDVIPATYMMRMLGLPNVRWFNQSNWSMIAASVIEAANALAAGACDYALVYRALHHPAGVRYHDNPATTAGGENQFTVPYGHGGGGPRQALHFQRYLEKYNAPREALADAVLNAHKNAQLNENAAWYGREITRDDYLNARIISWPMSLFDYDMPVDGAGAVIMTTEDRARGTPHPGGYIAGHAMTPHNLERGGIIESLEDLYEMDGLHAENLYRSAGLGPEDVDVLHLYDGFSPMMWTRMETFRFCGEGEAHAWATAERLALDGDQPFNTSGGNLGEGRLHGMAHVAETARQMMGTAGPRQIADAEVALCEVGPFAIGGELHLHPRVAEEGRAVSGPLSGIVVIEAANWLAAPSTGALMADLGADVVKVEPPGGDPFRGYDQRASGYDYDFALNYAFELDNRGKRSITVDLTSEGGPELVRRLCERADVFLTNLTQPRRERYGLTEDSMRAVRPSIIYASLTGYGTRGPDAERAGFDYSAFWARAGVMAALQQPPGSPPPLNRPGQGDHMTSVTLLAAVLAALRLRDQSGEGQYVEVTLQGTGLWSVGTDFSAALVAGQAAPRHDREAPPNPIWNSYQTRDGRWIVLVMLQPDRYWDQFCAAIGRPELALDGRSAAERFAEEGRELAATISEAFAEHDLAYWSGRLDEHGVIWAPAAELPEVIADPQVREYGWIRDVEHPEAGAYQTLGTPFQIRSAELGPRGPAPAAGEHTHEVLGEFGIKDDEQARLAERGVFG